MTVHILLVSVVLHENDKLSHSPNYFDSCHSTISLANIFTPRILQFHMHTYLSANFGYV